jgi:hypothetical protein
MLAGGTYISTSSWDNNGNGFGTEYATSKTYDVSGERYSPDICDSQILYERDAIEPPTPPPTLPPETTPTVSCETACYADWADNLLSMATCIEACSAFTFDFSIGLATSADDYELRPTTTCPDGYAHVNSVEACEEAARYLSLSETEAVAYRDDYVDDDESPFKSYGNVNLLKGKYYGCLYSKEGVDGELFFLARGNKKAESPDFRSICYNLTARGAAATELASASALKGCNAKEYWTPPAISIAHDASKCMEGGDFDDDCCASRSDATRSCADGFAYSEGEYACGGRCSSCVGTICTAIEPEGVGECKTFSKIGKSCNPALGGLDCKSYDDVWPLCVNEWGSFTSALQGYGGYYGYDHDDDPWDTTSPSFVCACKSGAQVASSTGNLHYTAWAIGWMGLASVMGICCFCGCCYGTLTLCVSDDQTSGMIAACAFCACMVPFGALFSARWGLVTDGASQSYSSTYGCRMDYEGDGSFGWANGASGWGIGYAIFTITALIVLCGMCVTSCSAAGSSSDSVDKEAFGLLATTAFFLMIIAFLFPVAKAKDWHHIGVITWYHMLMTLVIFPSFIWGLGGFACGSSSNSSDEGGLAKVLRGLGWIVLFGAAIAGVIVTYKVYDPKLPTNTPDVDTKTLAIFGIIAAIMLIVQVGSAKLRKSEFPIPFVVEGIIYFSALVRCSFSISTLLLDAAVPHLVLFNKYNMPLGHPPSHRLLLLWCYTTEGSDQRHHIRGNHGLCHKRTSLVCVYLLLDAVCCVDFVVYCSLLSVGDVKESEVAHGTCRDAVHCGPRHRALHGSVSDCGGCCVVTCLHSAVLRAASTGSFDSNDPPWGGRGSDSCRNRCKRIQLLHHEQV